MNTLFAATLRAVSILATASPLRVAPIPSGSYRPLFAIHGGRVGVAAFALDREPVTRADFLRFVRANPAWRRSAVDAAAADRGYLRDWPSDLDAGSASLLAAPVRDVSWFAARAYCASRGERLPTTDEWEYVAAADERRRDATTDPAFVQRLIAIYTTGRGDFRNVYGVSGLHGGGWEWTDDFDRPSHAPDAMSHEQAGGHDLYCAGAALGVPDPSNYPAFLRAAVRAGLTRRAATSHVGFRCAI